MKYLFIVTLLLTAPLSYANTVLLQGGYSATSNTHTSAPQQMYGGTAYGIDSIEYNRNIIWEQDGVPVQFYEEAKAAFRSVLGTPRLFGEGTNAYWRFSWNETLSFVLPLDPANNGTGNHIAYFVRSVAPPVPEMCTQDELFEEIEALDFSSNNPRHLVRTFDFLFGRRAASSLQRSLRQGHIGVGRFLWFIGLESNRWDDLSPRSTRVLEEFYNHLQSQFSESCFDLLINYELQEPQELQEPS